MNKKKYFLLIQKVCVGLSNIVPDSVTLWNLRTDLFSFFGLFCDVLILQVSTEVCMHMLDYGV
jgi:hypothetical protein